MTSIILNRIFQVNNDILVQPRVDELIMKLTPYMLYNKNKGSIRIVNTDIEPPNNNSKTNNFH